MSRGLGRTQRVALELALTAAIDEDGVPAWVTVDEVADALGISNGWMAGGVSVDLVQNGGHRQRLAMSRADREGIRRACRTLAKRGLVDVGDVRADRTGDYRVPSVCVMAIRRALSDDEARADQLDQWHKEMKGLKALTALEAQIGPPDPTVMRGRMDRAVELDELIRQAKGA